MPCIVKMETRILEVIIALQICLLHSGLVMHSLNTGEGKGGRGGETGEGGTGGKGE